MEIGKAYLGHRGRKEWLCVDVCVRAPQLTEWCSGSESILEADFSAEDGGGGYITCTAHQEL